MDFLTNRPRSGGSLVGGQHLAFWRLPLVSSLEGSWLRLGCGCLRSLLASASATPWVAPVGLLTTAIARAPKACVASALSAAMQSCVHRFVLRVTDLQLSSALWVEVKDDAKQPAALLARAVQRHAPSTLQRYLLSGNSGASLLPARLVLLLHLLLASCLTGRCKIPVARPSSIKTSWNMVCS